MSETLAPAPAPWLIQGDARRLPLADGVVQCVVTSPPYWALRDYGHEGADWDAISYRTIGGTVEVPAMRCPLGLEPTPEAFVGHMLTIFREVWRVLRDDGTCWMNIGDSYSNDTKWGGKSGGKNAHSAAGGYQGQRVRRGTDCDPKRGAAAPGQPKRRGSTGLKPKDLVGIPWMLAFALRADGWFLRQDVIWHKPGPMPESVRDRCTKAHEYIFLLTKGERYFYDNEAIKVPGTNRGCGIHAYKYRDAAALAVGVGDHGQRTKLGLTAIPPVTHANKRSVWRIATESCREAHFATFPTKLVEPCVLAGTSARGCCPSCRKPWARVVDKVRVPTRPGTNSKINRASAHAGSPYQDHKGMIIGNRDARRHTSQSVTSGWVPRCKCDAGAPVPCLVLDPFHGAGTTAIVAKRLGRAYVGNELSTEYLAISQRRIANDKPPRVKRARVPRAESPSQLSLTFSTASLSSPPATREGT